MSKKLQTVYVPTEKYGKFYLQKHYVSGWKDDSPLEPIQAYLYTEQEHQAAQQALSAAPTTQTNVLNELEKWVNKTYVNYNYEERLLSKIQSLKPKP